MNGKKKRHYRLQKKHFFAITAEILFLFLVFQLIGNFSFVEYSNPTVSLQEKRIDPHLLTLAAQIENESDDKVTEPMKYLVIGRDFSAENKEVSAVLETLEGMKLTYSCVKMTQAGQIKGEELPDSLKAIIICGDTQGSVFSERQREALLARGIHLIYTQMPTAEGIRKNKLESLLGIAKLQGMKKQQGMRFIDEVFLGGMLELEEISYEAEEVELEASCKLYAYALKNEEGEEAHAPLLWRNTVGKSKVFVVNGAFFEAYQGYGILAAILTQIYGDYLYPVINASVMIYEGLPYFGKADEEWMKMHYSRDSLQFQSDILMPNLVSICKRLDIVPSFYTSAENKMPEMDYFERAVLDLSGELVDAETAAVKAVSVLDLGGRIFSECSNLPVTALGFQKEEEQLARLYSLASAFGIVVHKVDIAELMNPESEKLNWVTAAKDYSEYLAYYREDFGSLKSMTAQNAAICYMEYLLMEPHISYGENCITVQIASMPKKASFFLRTKKTIEGTENCNYKKLKEGAYLIETQQSEFTIFLQEENAVYQGDF